MCRAEILTSPNCSSSDPETPYYWRLSATSALTLLRVPQWQSLCIEFGLVEVPDGSVNFDRPISPVLSEASGTTQRPSLARVNGNVCGKSYHMFPTSLTQAKQLLELHAHVNLVDYMELRKELQLARGQEDVGRIRVEIKALNLRSAKSLRRYVRAGRRQLLRNTHSQSCEALVASGTHTIVESSSPVKLPRRRGSTLS